MSLEGRAESFSQEILGKANRFIDDNSIEMDAETFLSDEKFEALLAEDRKLNSSEKYYELTSSVQSLLDARTKFFKGIQNEILRSAITEEFERGKEAALQALENSKTVLAEDPPMIVQGATMMAAAGGSDVVMDYINRVSGSIEDFEKSLRAADIGTSDDVANMLDDIAAESSGLYEAIGECYRVDYYYRIPLAVERTKAAVDFGSRMRKMAENIMSDERYKQYRSLRPRFFRARAQNYEALI